MVQDTITCPKCGEVIRLSQAISKDIEAELRGKLEKQIGDRVKREIAEKAAAEVADLKAALAEKAELLRNASQQELDLRKKQREIEERARAMEVDIARRIDRERREIIDRISQEAEEHHRLKDAEKEKQLTDMRRQIEDLKRKAEQGSQKIQGEVLELELEEALRREFPFDLIEPVSSGIKGGDIIQTVKTQSGRTCGKILWETKRTKNWSEQWIQKLKDDLRDVKADIAVLVSEALPDGFRQFREINGVWVTDVVSAVSLSLALRVVLNQVARERALQSGRTEKAELVYSYLTGPEFKNRVEAIIESFQSLKDDLDTERRAMERIWAKREKQIQQVLLNIAGMRGDIEGMSGVALPPIKALELAHDAEA